MSCLLGVPSRASLSMPARLRSRMFSFFFSLIIVKMKGTSAKSSTPTATRTAIQNGLSFIFFMFIEVSLLFRGLDGDGRGLPRLFADRRVQRHQIAPEILRSVVVGLEPVERLGLGPRQVRRLLLDAPEQRRRALHELELLDDAG